MKSFLSKIHPDNAKLAIGMVLNAGYLLIARSVGAVKELVIASRYGTSASVDALILGESLVTWLPSLLRNLGTFTLVPILVRRQVSPEAQADQFEGEVLTAALILGVVSSIAMWLLAPLVLPALMPLESGSLRDLAVTAAQLLAPISLVGMVSAVISIYLISNSVHQNTLFEASAPFALVVAVVLWVDPGIGPLVAGTTVGALLYLALVWRKLVAQGLMPRLAMPFKSSRWGELKNSSVALGVGVFLSSLTVLADPLIASSQGIGSNAVIGYTTRISALITTMLSISIVRSALPVFSKSLAGPERQRVLRNAWAWLWIVFGLGAAGALFVSFFSVDIVRLLFERGSFTSTDTSMVASLLPFAMLILPVFAVSQLLNQLHLALRHYKQIAAITSIAAITKLVLSYVLTERFGLKGIFLSTLVMYSLITLYLVLLTIKVQRSTGHTDS